MKPRFFLLFLLVILFSLSACNGKDIPEDTTIGGAQTVETPTENVTEVSDETENELNSSFETSVGTVTEPVDTTPSDEIQQSVYPTPSEITWYEGYVNIPKLKLDSVAADYADELTALGITVSDDGKPLEVVMRELTELEYGADEGYILTVTNEGIRIEAQTERGLHYGFMTLFQLINGTKCPLITVKDAPRNALRGVIEGFYGTAWSHEYRKELFAFMGEQKMNAYIYAPKDDPKHRTQWRVRYSGAELKRMEDLITTANENYVKFIYAISPGGDINLGAGYETDFEKLMAKCEQMYELGVRDFAIFLDDIPTLDAEGHARLLNDFQTKFVETHEGMSDLIAITTEYTDAFLTDYTTKIAPLIHEDIELMWTGPGVVPASITNASLKQIIKRYNRNVFIWWNYPVNDVLVNNLYMGACEGLEADLYQSITGLVANPMNQGYASMVPLFTTADYLWNPSDYSKKDSLVAACNAIAPDAAQALLDFISMTCESPMNSHTDSVELKTLLDAHKQNATAESLAALKAYYTRMVENAETLAAMENKDLFKDIAEWVEKYAAYGKMGQAFVAMEEEYAGNKDMNILLKNLGAYKAAEASVKANTRYVSNYVLTPYFNTLNNRINTLLGMGGDITFAPATAYTDCAHYEDYLAKYMTDGDDSTYFWTAGTLTQASNNGVGYFGVDLGEVITVTNIYVATGVGGSDALYQGAFEYSTDGKKWSRIEEGTYKDEILIEGLDIQARYIRMKQTDRSNTNWTKVRSFEVNTSRTIAAEPIVLATVTTNLPTYQTYAPSFACDGEENTYFWSAREGKNGDYIQLDLGAVIGVSRVTFKAGVAGHTADYIRSGELSYSADGQNWTVLGKINSRDTVMDVSIQARYFRVTVKAEQTNWITVSEFSATSDAEVSENLVLDEYFVPRTELLLLQDGHILSLFNPKGAEGHSLRVSVNESESLRILAVSLPEDGLTAKILDKNGNETGSITLTYDTSVNVPVGSVIVIPLGKGLILAEIQW